ncbi:MAG: hypothetical protein SCH70_14325 [Candidatus Methanoperedens sp.]|nr:hypothetical protein [Candidatus Methanoperedens sp.]
MIKTKHLREIEIPEKTLALQKKIVELNQLQVREKKLLSLLIKEKEKLAKISINKIITEE